jgi:hypothetical protein
MSERVAALLIEVADLHHRVYRRTDGADPDWPTWYAAWLVELSELPDLLGRPPTRTELTCLLAELDREVDDAPWPERYARRVVAAFAG